MGGAVDTIFDSGTAKQSFDPDLRLLFKLH